MRLRNARTVNHYQPKYHQALGAKTVSKEQLQREEEQFKANIQNLALGQVPAMPESKTTDDGPQMEIKNKGLIREITRDYQ